MNKILLVLIYLVIIFLITSLTKYKYKRYMLPNIIFTLLWCFCGIFSMYNNLGLIKPSLTVHIYIIISVITFNVIYFTLKANSIKKSSINDNIEKFKVNYRVVYYLALISMILIMPNLLKAIRVLLSSGFNLNAIREQVFVELSNSNSHILAFLTKNVPTAIFTGISLISSMEIFRSNNKALLKLNIFCILVGTITFGGRYLILNSIIFYVASFLIQKKYSKIKINKLYIFIAIAILMIVTISRGTNGLSIFDMIISYFVGSFSYLEVILRNSAAFGLQNPLLCGYLTFGFILEPLILALKLFFNANIDVPSYHINIYVQSFVNIGENSYILYNNNTTMLYNFLRDFGEVGIIIGTAIIAIIVCVAQKKYEEKNNLRALVFLIYMYSVIINSVMMYTMTSITTSLVIIVIVICIKNTSRKIKIIL